MNEHIPSFETSPLLRKIRDAFNARAPFKGKLRVSVADQAKWENADLGMRSWCDGPAGISSRGATR